MFSPQIHIVFNAKEDQRIISPIIQSKPNKVYYFTTFIKKTKQKDVNLQYFKNNSVELKKNLPNLEIIQNEVDYTDYIEIIQEISKIIRQERENNSNCKIYINVSSGSKMTALASVEASKLWNCEIYYVYASEYDPNSDGALHKGEMYMKIPTTFPIEKPPELYIKIIKLLESMLAEKYHSLKKYDPNKRKFIYKKKLLMKMYGTGLITLESENEDERKRLSSLYMKTKKLFAMLSDDLDYIEISNDRRNKKVYLTETGINITKIFKFLI